MVVGLVEPVKGAAINQADLIAWVKGKLAAYKAPRHVVAVPSIGRAANGKVDYRRLKSEAAAAVQPVAGSGSML